MKDAINLCLSDDPSKRLNLSQLEGETFWWQIENLLSDKKDDAAINFIRQFGTPDLVNYQEFKGKHTALLIACYKNRPAVMKELLAQGADPNLKNEEGYNGLLITLKYGDLESCKLIVEAGAKLNYQDEQGNTVLDFAVNSNSPCCEYLYS
jgi:ankyrin repeat protein